MTTIATSHSDLDLVLRDHPAYDLGLLYGAALAEATAEALTAATTTLDRASTLLDSARATERAETMRERATDRDDEAAAAYWYGVGHALTNDDA